VGLPGCGCPEIEIKKKNWTPHVIKYRQRFVSQNHPLKSAADLESRIWKNKIKN